MTREQIEQAAIKSADEELDDFECRGHRDGFIAGAQWRINSVWHNASEVPEMNKYLLVEDEIKNHFSIYKLVGQDWKDMVCDFNIFRWAYIEDLIPNKEGHNESKD